MIDPIALVIDLGMRGGAPLCWGACSAVLYSNGERRPAMWMALACGTQGMALGLYYAVFAATTWWWSQGSGIQPGTTPWGAWEGMALMAFCDHAGALLGIGCALAGWRSRTLAQSPTDQ